MTISVRGLALYGVLIRGNEATIKHPREISPVITLIHKAENSVSSSQMSLPQIKLLGKK
jgi:hypothetical protein